MVAVGVAAAAVLMALGLWFRGPRYEVVDLGTLGGPSASALSVNNVGQAVGWSDMDDSGAGSPQHAFLWDEEHGMRDLGTLGGVHSMAWDINDKGQVVGGARTHNDLRHAFLWDADNGMVDLGTLGGDTSYAFAINNGGQVVGSAKTAEDQTHAFLWDAERGMVDLGSLYGGRSLAKDINEKGQVVGLVSTGGKDHAFYWDGETGMVDLVGANGPSSVANSINNAGRIAGYVFNIRKNNYDACIWDGKGTIEKFNTQTVESYSGRINNCGQIIGYAEQERHLFFGGEQYYFLRTAKGRIINLKRYMTSEGHSLLQVNGINDAGWIVGQITASGGKGSPAVLLRPKGSGKSVSAVGRDD